MLRTNTPASPLCPTIRTRSPRMAPPVNGLVGSTAITPTVLPCARATAINRSIKVLLPAPGGPVIPIVQARNGRGPSRRMVDSAAGPPRSTRLMARASARGVSRTTGSTGIGGTADLLPTARCRLPTGAHGFPRCLIHHLAAVDLALKLVATPVEVHRQRHRAEALGVDDTFGQAVAGHVVRVLHVV